MLPHVRNVSLSIAAYVLILLAACAARPDEHRAAPAILATYRDPAACGSYHELKVFQDGTIHYTLGSGNRTVTEHVYQTSPAAAGRLIDLVASFDIRQDDVSLVCWRGEQSVPCKPDTSPFKSASPEDLQKFRRAVDAEAPIAWGQLPASRVSCAAAESLVSLSYALAIERGRLPH